MLALSLPVQAAVLDGFRDVLRLDLLRGGQVGNGAGHLDDPVVSAHGEAQGLEGPVQELPGFPGQGAVLLKVAGPQARVGQYFKAPVALQLPPAGFFHPGADLGRPLPGSSLLHLLVIHPGHLHLQVDPVQEGAREAGAVARHRRRAAGALPPRVV